MHTFFSREIKLNEKLVIDLERPIGDALESNR